ncbi:helicase-like protein, partial [Trifolium medium]|nr:helicase-like protein [Trifolium medium]
QPNVADQWVWRHDPGGGYTVQGAYKLLTFRDVQDADATSDLIWHKQVPLKVFVLA